MFFYNFLLFLILQITAFQSFVNSQGIYQFLTCKNISLILILTKVIKTLYGPYTLTAFFSVFRFGIGEKYRTETETEIPNFFQYKPKPKNRIFLNNFFCFY
jgi:hypothetical protein